MCKECLIKEQNGPPNETCPEEVGHAYQSHDTNMQKLHSDDIIKMAHVQTIVQNTGQ